MSKSVYFIRPIGMKGPIKIGTSRSPDGRLCTLATWSPFPLELVATIAGGVYLERQFHSLFAEQHRGREWFDWTPDLQRVMEAVAAGAFDTETLPDPKCLKRLPRTVKWSEESRKRVSLGARIRHIERKLNRWLPRDLSIYDYAHPESRLALEAFIADPIANGVSRDERFPPEEMEALRRRQEEWLARHPDPAISVAA